MFKRSGMGKPPMGSGHLAGDEQVISGCCFQAGKVVGLGCQHYGARHNRLDGSGDAWAQDADSRTPPSRTTGVDPNTGAAQGDSAGVEFEEGAAAFGGQLHAGVDHHFVPGVVVDFLSGLDELALAQLNVLVARDGQVVIGLDLGPAVGVGSVVLFGQVLGVAVGFDAFVAFVADADGLVVLNVLVPVALGVDDDLFLPGPVFDAQLVEAVAAGAAQALEDGSGFMLGQLVGHRVGAVVQAAADKWLVRVAFEEADQHFHADARDGDAAPVVAGPAAGHPQPAAGVGIGPALAVPVELDLDPALFVAVDFFAGRAGDHGGLLAQHAGFGMAQGWAVWGVPGGGGEVVAVALGEAWIPLSPAHYSPLRGSPFGPAFGCSALRLSLEGRGRRPVHS